jgi:thioredoxin 1
MLQKELEELSRESEEDIIFGKVDIEEELFLLQKYDISSVPTILFIKNGEMKEKLVGYYPKVIINENIKKIK